jgi:hypothetical protein
MCQPTPKTSKGVELRFTAYEHTNVKAMACDQIRLNT